MSTKSAPKYYRYYNAVAWSIVGVLALALLPWSDDWNYDGPRLFVLVVLLFFLSPTLMNWLAIVFFRFDPLAKNRLIFHLNNYLLSWAVFIDKIISRIPNLPLADGYYQHMHTLAINFVQYEEREKAEIVIQKLRSDVEANSGDESPLLLDVYALSISLFREADKHDECQQAISRFLTLAERQGADASAVTLVGPLSEAACYLAKMGNRKESEKTIAQSISLFDSIEDQASKDICRPLFLTNLGLAYCYNEKLDKALPLLREHQEFVAKKDRGEGVESAIGNCNLTWILNELLMYEESCKLCETTIEICEKSKLSDDLIKRIILGNYADALAGLDRVGEAKEIVDQKFPTLIQIRSKCMPELAATYRTMAKVSVASGENSTAVEHYEKAISLLNDSVGSDHPRTKRWSKELADIRTQSK